MSGGTGGGNTTYRLELSNINKQARDGGGYVMERVRML